MENKLILEQRQILSAKQVQSLDILTLTNQELDDFLVNEYLENPMLECSADKENDMLVDVERLYEKGTSYKEQYMNSQEEISRSHDIAAVPPDEVKSMLLGQLIRGAYSDEDWKLFGYLIDCLDSGGFFTYETEEMAHILTCGKDQIQRCLSVLKGLEPSGIFSKDLSECLLRQLEDRGICDDKLSVLIRDHLKDIMEGHIGTVSRSLGLSTASVKEYIHIIGSLNPRPIMSAVNQKNQYLVPDIIVSRQDGVWEVKINDQWMGEYTLNDYYIKMMQESQDPELTAYFRDRMERARFVVNCVEQRRATLLRIVAAIMEIQIEYFNGTGQLKPMCLNDVAQVIDMHASTVSRAIKGKYLQYRKAVLIKDLFAGSAPAAESRDTISTDQIKSRIKSMIEAEDGTRPLSDLKISEKLQSEAIQISRRAVAKYRIQMGILDSRQRLYYKKEV